MKKKKKHPFNVLSNVECTRPSCKTKLKLRIVEDYLAEKNSRPRLCFSCHKEKECGRGHQMQ